MKDEIKKQITGYISKNKVMVFMKGTPDMPQCGFSKTVVDILNFHDVSFGHCNILEDQDLRQGIKEYSDWPTIPQVFIDGEFVGGCDIILELNNSGELGKMLEKVK